MQYNSSHEPCPFAEIVEMRLSSHDIHPSTLPLARTPVIMQNNLHFSDRSSEALQFIR